MEPRYAVLLGIEAFGVAGSPGTCVAVRRRAAAGGDRTNPLAVGAPRRRV